MNTKLTRQVLTVFLCCWVVGCNAQANSYDTRKSKQQAPAPGAKLSTQELQQLVAPIALYPDALVAQVLAASTFPDEIVEADRWMHSHSNLKGEELAREVNKQAWDASVKALTQFPSVLENMDKNLSWTSSLGDTFANQPQDVTDAVQAMREKARKAGHLNSGQQENVKTQGNTIIIEPANPEVVYVPAYDPWLVYGAPIVAYPGWFPVPGIFYAGPEISFGIGFGIGYFGGFGWGWGHWGYDWHRRSVIYNHNVYVSDSRTITNRNNHASLNHANFNHGHGNAVHASRAGGRVSTSHRVSASHSRRGTRSSAFSGFDRGGTVRSFSSHGRSSFGGFGGSGFHGGGFHGGGGRR
jgi:hypothetical protein